MMRDFKNFNTIKLLSSYEPRYEPFLLIKLPRIITSKTESFGFQNVRYCISRVRLIDYALWN